MNEQHKHLEFIQNVITRLSSNSFQIKGWAVAIVAAILAIYATTKNKDFIFVGVFSCVVFWIIDAYCLRQERRYRGFYKDVAKIHGGERNVASFDMDTSYYSKGQCSFWHTFFTKTIWIVYLLIMTCLIVILFL